MGRHRQRIFLVGVGFIGARHVEAARALDEGVEVHATDLDPERLEALRAEHPMIRGHRDLDAMLGVPSAADDLVIIATPPASHCEIALRAFESGRHVLCEKPLATTMAEARRMLEAARSADRRLGCCSGRFLGQPNAERLRADLAAGALGPLYRIAWTDRRARARSGIEYLPETMRWALTRARNGGGILMDWGPYDLTTLHHLIAPRAARVMDAWAASPEAAEPGGSPPPAEMDVEQHVGARLRYTLGDGREVGVDLDRAACTHGPERREALFEATRGAAVLDFCGDDLAYRFDEKGAPVERAIEAGASDVSPHHRPLRETLRALRGEPASAVLDAEALFSFAVLCAIYEVAEGGGPVDVERASFEAAPDGAAL